MKQPKHIPMIRRIPSTFLAGCACLLLGSCASTPDMPPPPGAAIIDATPDPRHQNRVEGVELVSINGKSVQGTRCVIAPGLNIITTRLRWPQGLVQEADLRFYATPGTVYLVKYDLYPSDKDDTTGLAQKLEFEANKGMGLLYIAPLVAAVAVVEKTGVNLYNQRPPATHIDLKVVAHQSGQGIVRQVRAYPDGRVDGKPWAAWAQMKAP